MGDDYSSDDARTDASDDALSNTDEDEIPLSPSIVFGILADKQDRFVLYLLKERGGTIALDELATAVAAWENETRPELITKEMEDRMQTQLYHASIPKLAEYGLVVTQESEAVTLTERGEQLDEYLEFAKERERRDVQQFLAQNQRDHDR
ncbi:DUF7344 domain-containing protein [Halopiger aswanensis]|uniref:DUF7344 domain-containing protein n=1 Tax=Halopiger aswanensis TaxID=148449 RepID=A0A3R7HFJ6_9EURY|nr:hypothetical protein [Halopiger aswanensis]RKD85237.1 hypothetical protein ATJ93_4741 [Halopiger aswanensis]